MASEYGCYLFINLLLKKSIFKEEVRLFKKFIYAANHDLMNQSEINLLGLYVIIFRNGPELKI